ncbi:MAG: uridylate kinase [Christensenellaceae bacterium]|jgi:glutamate 5-kinase|nr:uridylate kinase [Christensenellaceae bacterium]
MKFDIDIVGKIGSMALINRSGDDLDYNILASISRELKPGMVWITSGAVEIGRLDYMKRMNGIELTGRDDDIKTDYAAQGQIILLETYRRFIKSSYSLRQFLVEHQHFNHPDKREHLKNALLRCPPQKAVPIINYNDPVSYTENRKMEIKAFLTRNGRAAECVDNDETASEIACLLKPKFLILLTSVDGIFKDINDKTTLIKEISGKDETEVINNIEYYQAFCKGASRPGANGAGHKLEFVKEPVKLGTTVYIANSIYKIADILKGNAPSTVLKVR